MLEAIGITKAFGALVVADDVHLAVGGGAREAVIGPNGAGKTTLFNILGGQLKADAGAVRLDGREITGLAPEARARAGLGRSFQRNNLFPDLTVAESLATACALRRGQAPVFWRGFATLAGVHEQAGAIAERAGLADLLDRRVRHLSYGNQRQLEVALALACEPSVLLLDEPTAGMSPEETRTMKALIERLPHDLTVLMIEHDMDVVFDIAERVTVLDYGKVIASGTPDEIRASDIVREIYLGRDDHILQGVSFEVPEGSVVSLLGRNGAGKTTTLRSIMRLTPPRRGRVRFGGRSLDRLAPHRIACAGIALVHETRGIFPSLTVRENLEIASRKPDQGMGWTLERAFALFPRLRERERQGGTTLSGGEQQMLAIARALVANPRLILMDEPTEGLAPIIVAEIRRVLEGLKAEGVTMLLVEQNFALATALADHNVVIGKGQVRWQGPSGALRQASDVTGTWLGV
jgi:branched-chain amino acid transport system ATP-binding protein